MHCALLVQQLNGKVKKTVAKAVKKASRERAGKKVATKKSSRKIKNGKVKKTVIIKYSGQASGISRVQQRGVPTSINSRVRIEPKGVPTSINSRIRIEPKFGMAKVPANVVYR